MCNELGYVELAGGVAGAAASVFLALPTWRDVRGKERAGRLKRLAGLVAGTPTVLDDIAKEHAEGAHAFRPVDKRDLLVGMVLIGFAFVLPVLNKFALLIFPAWHFCIG